MSSELASGSSARFERAGKKAFQKPKGKWREIERGENSMRSAGRRKKVLVRARS
jgi:hypothetical protein